MDAAGYDYCAGIDLFVGDKSDKMLSAMSKVMAMTVFKLSEHRACFMDKDLQANRHFCSWFRDDCEKGFDLITLGDQLRYGWESVEGYSDWYDYIKWTEKMNQPCTFR